MGEDERLLDGVREGQPGALDELLRRHEAQIYRFGMAMCRDADDAKDILQDTLLAMARNVRQFRGDASLSTWLYKVARSMCIKKRRRSKFAPDREESLDEAPAQAVHSRGPSPEDRAAQREVGRALQEAVAALDPDHREVLLLRDIEGLSAAEVADVLDLTIPAVKSRLHRARARVREHLAAPPPPAAGCPDIVQLFSQNLEGEVTADVCAVMQAHLLGCPRCTAICDGLQDQLVACRTEASAVVPAAVQASVRAAVRTLLAAGPP